MWREYLYFTRRQRRGIWILITLIVLIVIIGTILPDRYAAPIVSDYEQWEREYEEFMDGLREKDAATAPTVRQALWKNESLFPFDPNQVDSATLTRLGLPGWMARNVIRYREKGGQFRDTESFRKIYGMSDDLYNQLQPYIYIEPEKAQATANTSDFPGIQPPEESIPEYTPVVKYAEGTIVNLNRADTTELKHIPGIGSGIARQIVGYRQQLGGFHSTRQLLEIKYVSPDMLSWFAIGTDTLKKISINRASVERLRSHPYLNFYQAKAIVEHRRKRGAIKDIEELKLYEEFTPEDLERIAPYLSYE